MTMTSEYAAGFFDGEGCVSISPDTSRTTHYLLGVSVVNTNRDVLVAFLDKYGGKIQQPPSSANRGKNCKPVWTWRIDAAAGERFLLDVYPHLIVKRERVRLALFFRVSFRPEFALARGREASLPSSIKKRERVMDFRSRCYSRMKTLNARGVS